MSKPTDWEAVHRARYAAGLVDEVGLSRRVRSAKCPRCGAHVLGALDGDLMAVSVLVDPWPLDVQGELLALLDSPPRGTYRLSWTGGRYELNRRSASSIRRSSPDDVEVVSAHRCGTRLPAAQRARKPPRAPSPPTDGAPPF